MQHHLDLHTTE